VCKITRCCSRSALCVCAKSDPSAGSGRVQEPSHPPSPHTPPRGIQTPKIHAGGACVRNERHRAADLDCSPSNSDCESPDPALRTGSPDRGGGGRGGLRVSGRNSGPRTGDRRIFSGRGTSLVLGRNDCNRSVSDCKGVPAGAGWSR
jgi:hypothetical protein